MSSRKRITNLFICFICFIFVISSCSHREIELNETVTMSSENNQESSLRINDTGVPAYSGYGPQPTNLENQNDNTLKNHHRSFALVFMPSYNNSFMYLHFLKAMEQRNIKPSIISGFGQGALVGSLYSKFHKVSSLEWFMFKTIQKVESTDPSTWNKEFTLMAISELSQFDISASKPTLVLPLFDSRQDRVELMKKGNISSALRLTTLMDSSREGYLAAWIKSVDITKMLRELGVDKVIYITAFGKKVNFEKTSDYYLGVYGSYLSVQNNIQLDSKNVKFINLNIDNRPQDKVPSASIALKHPTDTIDEAVMELESILKNKE